MRALVLEKKDVLSIRDIDLPLTLEPDSVKIRVHTVGICGSDVHYYRHGGAGAHQVKSPMVLGHEAAGTIVEVGPNVRHLKVGDRVCMEPGIPNIRSKAVMMGRYNVDPDVRFWATPPIHGCLTEFVTHPAAFTFKLPDHVSFAEGAMVEPFAVGMHAVAKAPVSAGDVGIVLGAGPIGIMIALAALAGGCSTVFITDLHQPKLDIAGRYAGIVPINVGRQDVEAVLMEATGGWGADVVFEASGAPKAIASTTRLACPGGKIVFVGVPVEVYQFDLLAAMNKELRIETIFRYVNVFERAINLIASGKVDLKPLISATFGFEDSIKAFERARDGVPTDVKLQITI